MIGAVDTLEFDEAAHVYRFGGQVVPGVTSILQPLVDFSKVPRDVLEAKRDLGQRVHLACQLDDEHDLDEDSVETDVAPYLSAWRRFLRETGARVLENEQRVFHRALRYAGTLDNILQLNGKIWLADKKTSIAAPMSVGPQTAAYVAAFGMKTVTHRASVQLRPDGTYQFVPLTGQDDYAVFLSCLTIHKFKESMK